MDTERVQLRGVWRKLGIERSNEDARQSNESFRATAQALILINGGGATAVLAFLTALISKEKVEVHLLNCAGATLIFYAVGVAFAPAAIWLMSIALKIWNRSWREVIAKDKVFPTDANKHAERWHLGANLCFGVSITCFLTGSIILAAGFFSQPTSPPKISTQTLPAEVGSKAPKVQ